MHQNATIERTRFHLDARTPEWAQANIATLAEKNAQNFSKHPWHERWDMDPNGTDTRLHSFACVRELIAHRSDFFSCSTRDGEIVGFAAGTLLTEQNISEITVSKYGAQIGHYYMAVIVIDEHARGQGLLGHLAEMRLSAARVYGCSRAWLVTHPSQGRVAEQYEKRGFTIAASYHTEVTGFTSPRIVYRGAI
jgi:ribosomal protein S18 acetylase RimI-like enzyme